MQDSNHIFFDELSIVFSQERLDGYLSHAKCNNSKTNKIRWEYWGDTKDLAEQHKGIINLTHGLSPSAAKYLNVLDQFQTTYSEGRKLVKTKLIKLA